MSMRTTAGQSAATEAVIEVASALKNEAARLYDAYVQLPAILEKERRAIKGGALQDLEEAGAEKAGLGDRVEQAFGQINLAAERLGKLQVQILGEGRRPATLKESLSVLDALSEVIGHDTGLGAQVLRHQIDGLRQLVVAFDERLSVIQPMIDANKILLQTMLASYQESCRFWQQVAEETSAAYTAKGIQQSAGRASMFRARA